jgi:peptidoglycan/xylan/chitin deacetylase (PgdA/CDA1 family)
MKWPNGIRVGVCLTFDVDGPLIWRSKVRVNPKFGNPVCVSLGEFGPEVGVPRILKLLDKYDIKAGFFIPGGTIEEYPEMVKRVHTEGHEIGFHSYAHVNPADLSYEEQRADFEKGLDLFERTFKVRPYGYRSPAADMDEKTWDLLEEYGFVYDSTMMKTDFPYLRKGTKQNIVVLPMHWMLDDWPHFGWNMYPSFPYQANIQSQEAVYEIWKGEFDGMYQLDEGCVYALCCHPQLIGRASRILMLERLIQHIRQFPNVWIAKPIELAREAQKALSNST